jgi:hypothetical protein
MNYKIVRESGILNSSNENLYRFFERFHLAYLIVFYFSFLPFGLPAQNARSNRALCCSYEL